MDRNKVLKEMINEFDLLLYTFLQYENISENTLCQKIMELFTQNLEKIEKKTNKYI